MFRNYLFFRYCCCCCGCGDLLLLLRLFFVFCYMFFFIHSFFSLSHVNTDTRAKCTSEAVMRQLQSLWRREKTKCVHREAMENNAIEHHKESDKREKKKTFNKNWMVTRRISSWLFPRSDCSWCWLLCIQIDENVNIFRWCCFFSLFHWVCICVSLIVFLNYNDSQFLCISEWRVRARYSVLIGHRTFIFVNEYKWQTHRMRYDHTLKSLKNLHFHWNGTALTIYKPPKN